MGPLASDLLQRSQAALEAMIDTHLGEAEGILVPLYGVGKSTIHLKRPL